MQIITDMLIKCQKKIKSWEDSKEIKSSESKYMDNQLLWSS